MLLRKLPYSVCMSKFLMISRVLSKVLTSLKSRCKGIITTASLQQLSNQLCSVPTRFTMRVLFIN